MSFNSAPFFGKYIGFSSEFNNKYLPFKSSILEYQPNSSPFDIAKLVIVRIHEIFKNLKSFMYFPSLEKNPHLLELAKLTDDLIECIHVYVQQTK